MPRALKVCSTAGCWVLVPKGRCAACEAKADRARGTAAERGYDHRWSTRTRRSYLARHPLCAIQLPGCTRLATVPDHHPLDRRQLVRLGVPDPDADHRLRPACAHCHGVATAHDQPGGWHAQ